MNKSIPSGTKKYMMIITAVIFYIIVSANNVFAQDNTNTNSETKIEKTGTPHYINYKGIEDINEAKKAWTIDHPEEVPVVVKVESKTGIDERAGSQKEIKEVNNNSEKIVVSLPTPENQPYLNYKGIANPKEARKVWMAENPEAAKQLNDKLQKANLNQNSSTKTKQ